MPSEVDARRMLFYAKASRPISIYGKYLIRGLTSGKDRRHPSPLGEVHPRGNCGVGERLPNQREEEAGEEEREREMEYKEKENSN